MNAEIIAIGTELLLGEVVNSNAAWISRELAALGVDVYHHVTVGDNPQRIRETLKQAAKRADWLILTGGLGPTEDDLTVVTLADCFQSRLISDPTSEAAIRRVFDQRGLSMPANNLKQALRPEGATPLNNPIGTAPGLAWEISGIGPEPVSSLKLAGRPVRILAFPGVPRELHAMWPQAREWIRQVQREQGEEISEVLVTRFLHFFGISESVLAERLKDILQTGAPSSFDTSFSTQTPHRPSIAPYVDRDGIRLRLAVKASDISTAESLLAPLKADILRLAEDYFIGEGDEASTETGGALEQKIADILIPRGWRLGLAESCTGGLISAQLTDIPGSSAFMAANVVTYCNEEKIRRLGVRPETLDTVGAVSRETAAEMALGIQRDGGYEIGLSITGFAGPVGEQDRDADAPPNSPKHDQRPGLAYIGICPAKSVTGIEPSSATVIVREIRINPAYSRSDSKIHLCRYALFFLWKTLRQLTDATGP